MNRLVIIGNGFDLAHGLPTSYRHFIDDYWESIASQFKTNQNESIYEDEFVRIVFKFDDRILVYQVIIPQIREIKNYKDFQKFINKYSQKQSPPLYRNGCIFNFQNKLFENICNKSIENWVDVENEYYSELKKAVKSRPSNNTITDEQHVEEKRKKVKKLNDELYDVKDLLEKYLSEKVEKSFEMSRKNRNDNDWTQFYYLLKPISSFNNEHNLRLEFNELGDRNELDIFFIKERQDMTLNKSNSLFLNFNYTSTLEKYIASLKEGEMQVEINQIHGVIYNNENKINFGFGDEMDDDYKMIENIDDNEYLKNFKSFQYLQNSNYSKLLNFIDSAKFQIYIMGHSCGLSDRTLLNTLFEHENCRSIKVFYHEIKDENGNVLRDNYTEITQNISRHFNKKKLMREKIVNKTLCQSLPQIQLPKKQNDPQS